MYTYYYLKHYARPKTDDDEHQCTKMDISEADYIGSTHSLCMCMNNVNVCDIW